MNTLRSAARPDAHRLRNLPLPTKIFASAAVVLALVVSVAAWTIAAEIIDWSAMSMMSSTGGALAVLWDGAPLIFAGVVALTLGSMAGLYGASHWLFARSSLRARVRSALVGAARAALVTYAVVLLTAPFFAVSGALVGPLGAVVELMLVAYAALPLSEMWLHHRWRNAPDQPRRVVIVGGGFAGLYAALEADRRLGHDPRLSIELVDKNNYFLFPPLLPSASTGTIETRQVTFPFRRGCLETTNVHFRKGTVEQIDPRTRRVLVSVDHGEHTDPTHHEAHTTELAYDYLLVAPGAVSNTFRTKGAEEHAFFMRELGDAIAVRDQVIDCFERAAASPAPDVQEELLRFVVVGAGPTGIEVATEIHDLDHHVLLKRYPEIDAARVEILLVQSGGRVLPGWREEVVALATRQLERLAIRVVLDARVEAIGPDHVIMAGGVKTKTRTCIWCAGVRPAPLLERSGLVLDKSGRAPVRDDLRAVGFDDVFVLGDAALFVDPRANKPLPPLGQVAFQQGPHAAKNVLALLEGRRPEPFRYFDYGALISVGEHYAAVDLLGVRLSGFIGWFVWRTLYLMKLVGASNKLRIMIDWTLDLLIERSFTQLGAPARGIVRDDVSARSPRPRTARENDAAAKPAATA